MTGDSQGLDSMSELATRYLKGLERHGYSPATIANYGYALNQLLAFLGKRGVEAIGDVDLKTLEKFRNEAMELGHASSTAALRVRAVKTFFRHLEDEGLLFENPAFRLKGPRVERTMGHIPSEEDMRKLLAAPDLSTPWGLRDRAVLEVAYSTGIRLGELTRLNLADVDFKNELLRVFGKGRKERVVPLGKHALEYLGKYLSGARRELLRNRIDEDALWIGTHKRRMSHAAFGVRFGEHSMKAGIPRTSPHAIRRACATHTLRGGAHPEMVRRMLGHSCLRTLSRYIGVSIEDLKETHRNSGLGK